MTSQNALVETDVPAVPTIGMDEDTVKIETRFGEMEFHLDHTISMPRGMLGYADYRDFGLANMPDPKLEQFKLLQCLESPELSFIVASLNPEADMIEPDDIRDACEGLSVDPETAIVLLVVTTRRIGTTVQISVNLRAPIILDPVNRKAYQHVLLNNRYSVRQVIGTSTVTAD